MGRILSRKMIARHRRHPIVRWTAQRLERLLDGYHNVNYDAGSNGEAFVLARIGQTGPKQDDGIVVDAGAHTGQWTRLARQAMPALDVHCFEIAPPLAAELAARTAGDAKIIVNHIGLWDQATTVKLRYAAGTPLSTVTDAPLDVPVEEIMVPVRRGDAYLAELGNPPVFLLKIDVEGAEREVIAGFSGAFERGAVSVVQVEYGGVNLRTRFLLADMYDFFTRRGFAFGKIYPGYVDFRDMETRDEDFRGPNYLAVHRSRADLISMLSG
jgi:FkbM family methyltransferase